MQEKNKRRLEYVLNQAVDVKIIHSFLDMGKSCLHKITLKE